MAHKYRAECGLLSNVLFHLDEAAVCQCCFVSVFTFFASLFPAVLSLAYQAASRLRGEVLLSFPKDMAVNCRSCDELETRVNDLAWRPQLVDICVQRNTVQDAAEVQYYTVFKEVAQVQYRAENFGTVTSVHGSNEARPYESMAEDKLDGS
uniref:Kinesin motor domain-containing protein n=1 Tax=Ascaris lumbricoides TaxID=6252 RepID=A0A0M3IDC1_ASCLU